MKKKLHQDIYISIITYVFTAVMFILGRNIKSSARAYPFLILGLISLYMETNGGSTDAKIS